MNARRCTEEDKDNNRIKVIVFYRPLVLKEEALKSLLSG